MGVEEGFSPVGAAVGFVETVCVDSLERGEDHGEGEHGESCGGSREGRRVRIRAIGPRRESDRLPFLCGVGQRRCAHTRCKQRDSEDLATRVAAGIEKVPDEHGGDGAAGANDDMQRDGDLVRKRPVIEEVDSHEECRVDEPGAQRDSAGGKEEAAQASGGEEEAWIGEEGG